MLHHLAGKSLIHNTYSSHLLLVTHTFQDNPITWRVPISEVQGASSLPAPWHLSLCSAKPPIPAGSWGPCCAVLCVRASVSMGSTGTAFPPQAKYLQVVPWGQGCSCRTPAKGLSVFSLDHVLTPQLRSSPSVRSCLMAFFSLYCLQWNEQMVPCAGRLLSHLCTFSTNRLGNCLVFPCAPRLPHLPCQRSGVPEKNSTGFLLT